MCSLMRGTENVVKLYRVVSHPPFTNWRSMAANEGGGAPPLPKRPPGIPGPRDDTDNDARPVRPAPPRPVSHPPPPGHRPPSITVSPTDGTAVSPDGGLPLLPKLPPPPSKSRPVKTENGSAKKPASIRKRPEITIVSAQPMSEIGFRGETKTPSPGVTPTSPVAPPSGSNTQRVSAEMSKVPPPRPKSITMPMGDGPEPRPQSRPSSLATGPGKPPPDPPSNLIDFSAETVAPNYPVPKPRPKPAARSRTPDNDNSTQSIPRANSDSDNASETDTTGLSSTLLAPTKPTRPTIIRPKVANRTNNQEPAETGSVEKKSGSGVLSVVHTTPANDASVNELKAAFAKRQSTAGDGALPPPPLKPKPKPAITKKPVSNSGDIVANRNSETISYGSVSVNTTIEQFSSGMSGDNVDEKPNFPTRPSRRKRPTIIRTCAKPITDTTTEETAGKSEPPVRVSEKVLNNDSSPVSRPPPPSKSPVGDPIADLISLNEDNGKVTESNSVVRSESNHSLKSPGRPPLPSSVPRLPGQGNKDKNSDSDPVRPKPVARKPARPKSASTDDLRSAPKNDTSMTKLSLPPGTKTQDDAITPPPRKRRAGPPRPSQQPLSGSRSHSSLSDKDTGLSLFTETKTEDSKPSRPSAAPPTTPGKSPLPKQFPEATETTPAALPTSRRVIIHEVYPQSEAPKLPPRPSPGHPLFHYIIGVPYGLAVATHDYQSMQPDELAFNEGELLVLLRRIDSSWLYGKNGEIEGMFPTSYVKIVEALPGETMDEIDTSAESSFFEDKHKPDTGTGPRCRARFEYEGGGDGDLTFEEGEIIQLLERVGDDWMKGQVQGRVGMFPLTFVEIIEDLPETPQGGACGLSAMDMGSFSERFPEENKSDHGEDRLIRSALFDFKGEEDELCFKTGDRIVLISRVNEEWLYGECNGRTGQFPSVFIDLIPADLPQYHSPTQEKVVVDSFVDKPDVELKNDTSPMEVKTPQSETSSDAEEAYGIAMHDFSGEGPDDLKFKLADKIVLLERVDSEWIRGRLELTGQVGLLPAAFVQIITDLKEAPAKSAVKKTTGTQVKSLYKFTGQGDKELSFEEGEIILMQEPVGPAAEWYWGELHGKRGMFPVAFIESI